MLKIAIFSQTEGLLSEAQALAQRLHLPLSTDASLFDYLLVLTPDALQLQKTTGNLLPLAIDFLSGKIAYRRQHTSLRRETLARAMGLKNHATPKILDATAGLGRDSFILASLGFEVTLLERSPLIHSLLEDGLKRAAANSEIAPIANRMHLVQADAISWMQAHAPFDIIYLDPMFPERNKSALVKKEMRIFQDIIGEDADANTLLNAALACATQRVVVKRPRLSPALTEFTPSFSQTGSSSRFDIYLI